MTCTIRVKFREDAEIEISGERADIVTDLLNKTAFKFFPKEDINQNKM